MIMRVCEVEGCNKKIHFKLLCALHYNRFKRHGDVNITLRDMHGLRNHRLYDIHISMLRRCYNESHKYYEYYGGRGITVCDRWRGKGGLKNFISDMYCSFIEGLQIDRRDNNENYTYSNCHWVTPKENCNNRRARNDNKK